MKNLPKYSLAALLTVLAVAFVGLSWGGASASRGISVTPGYVRVSIDENETAKDASIAIKNDFAAPVTIEASVVDVDTADGLLAPKDTSLTLASQSVKLSTKKFVLEANKSVNLLLQVDGQKLPPGGHYAAVMLKQLDPNPKARVPIVQALSVGLFIAKNEGAKKQLDAIVNWPASVSFQRPKTVVFYLKNSGNIDLVPAGSVTIKNGEAVMANAVINESSAPLFAGQQAEFAPLLRFTRSFLPDRYSVTVQYRYLGQAEPVVVKKHFWYVPVWSLVTVIALCTLPVAYRYRRMLGKLLRIRK